MGTKVPPEETSSENVVLTWKYPDGSVASGRLLPREQAERLARVYGGMYPDQTYWLEPVPLQDTSEYTRVQRRRVPTSPRKAR